MKGIEYLLAAVSYSVGMIVGFQAEKLSLIFVSLFFFLSSIFLFDKMSVKSEEGEWKKELKEDV